VVTVGPGDALDHADQSQATQLTREGAGRECREQSDQVCPANAVDIELGALQGTQQLLLGPFEEVQSLDRPVAVVLLFSEAIQRAKACAAKEPERLRSLR
ncbi:MAG TPA: hypothetical protein VG994_04020, partial [Steroidobacteraceae bacterium]|nr:hypothetical protein [Steroidobacteraceae bacterium]